jgi:hypothetical protein
VEGHNQSKGYMKNNWLFFVISTYIAWQGAIHVTRMTLVIPWHCHKDATG